AGGRAFTSKRASALFGVPRHFASTEPAALPLSLSRSNGSFREAIAADTEATATSLNFKLTLPDCSFRVAEVFLVAGVAESQFASSAFPEKLPPRTLACISEICSLVGVIEYRPVPAAFLNDTVLSCQSTSLAAIWPVAPKLSAEYAPVPSNSIRPARSSLNPSSGAKTLASILPL